MKRSDIAAAIGFPLTEPAGDLLGRPLRRLVSVAVIARVRGAEFYREVGPRNSKTMVMAAIDHHVASHRHVARSAAQFRAASMLPVRNRLVFRGRVTLSADGIDGGLQLAAVRIVAIAAGDAGRKHLAQLERRVVVGFLIVTHLPVGMEKPALERRDPGRLRQRLAGLPVLRELPAPRMAKAAGLDLLAYQGRRRVPSRQRSYRVRAPRHRC